MHLQRIEVFPGSAQFLETPHPSPPITPLKNARRTGPETRNIYHGNFLKPTGKMHMDSASPKKKVALLGIPDDALDVLTHYTQGTDWETTVVVSVSADAYAARIA